MKDSTRNNTPSAETTVLKIRKVDINDIPTLLELENSVAGTPLYSAMLEEREWLETISNEQVFFIELNGTIIGNLSYDTKDDSHVHISGLVIHPTHQGKGYGRQVLTHILNQFSTVPKIDLVTHPDNPARLLYESLGFVVTERKENYFDDGEPRIVLELLRK